MNTTLSEIITTGLNNPDCSFFTGAVVGQMLVFRWVITFFVLHFIFKIIEKLALDPLITWLKKKIFSTGKKCKSMEVK